jgi:hypothetical protein
MPVDDAERGCRVAEVAQNGGYGAVRPLNLV